MKTQYIAKQQRSQSLNNNNQSRSRSGSQRRKPFRNNLTRGIRFNFNKTPRNKQIVYTPKQIINTNNAFDESIIIKKKQTIMTVRASNNGEYRLTSQIDAGIGALNPGNSSMGWLAQVATAYTKYQVIHFQLDYVPSTSTTAVGNVSLYIDYEGGDIGPTDISQFYDQKDSVTSALYKPFTKNFAVKDLMSTVKEKIISSDPGFDVLYDMGVIYVCTQGFSKDGGDTSDVGLINMTYTIKLMVPQNNSNIAKLNGVAYNYNLADPEFAEGQWLYTRDGHLALNHQSSDINGLPHEFQAHQRGTLNIYSHVSYTAIGGAYVPNLLLNGVQVNHLDYVNSNVAGNQHNTIMYWQFNVKPSDVLTFEFNHNSINYNYVSLKIYNSSILGTIDNLGIRKRHLKAQQQFELEHNEPPVLTRQDARINKFVEQQEESDFSGKLSAPESVVNKKMCKRN